MCGTSASLPRISMIELSAIGGAAVSGRWPGDTIPEGFRVVATSKPQQAVKGSHRAEVVATHLRIANRELVSWWGMATESMYSPESRAAFQAGAAATEAFANLLDALSVRDGVSARAVIEQFVNDAVDTGVVAV